ncbi:E3 ubiquitin-protein ligase HECTD2 [Sporothrix schenckii 1099-18]|uniref:HECT-type E3 ubiquitin transferase n=1 Tax=Sporothrix schenckii 1099-18 TaxID=1397361 RepID=A0A0F2M6U8_SPOSC|nr:E3 ubiquitin-protein ligase HECTD2 [Sporothrix schenckii 1099-18]KJR83896.1 E3 ubiquitin-protein ligase HECTD2 [Sporothrix schenckii 1099-18]
MTREPIRPPNVASYGGVHDEAGSRECAPASVSTSTSTSHISAVVSLSQSSGAQPKSGKTRRTQHTQDASVAVPDLALPNLTISQLHFETDSSDPGYQATRRTTAGSSHSRSLSNPFPSLFSPKKKKAAHTESSFGSGGSTSGTDGEMLSTRTRREQQDAAHSPTLFGVGRSERPSFASGPCITCGSLMRWARGAEAFRCGICLTVNDLIPVNANLATTWKPQATSSYPISVKQTQHIVSECIRDYLETVLTVVDMHPSRPRRNSRQTIPNDAPVGPRTPPKSRISGQHRHSKLDGAMFFSSRVSQQASPISNASHVLSVRGDKREEIEAKRIFQALEDYVIRHIVSINSLDGSFVPTTNISDFKDKCEGLYANQKKAGQEIKSPVTTVPFESDKRHDSSSSTIISENSSWRPDIQHCMQPIRGFSRRRGSEVRTNRGTDAPMTSDVDWGSVDEWYNAVINSGASWESVYNELVGNGRYHPQSPVLLSEVESCILKGQQHTQRVLLKATETVLKRPGRRIGEVGDYRFLIIALANPLLHAQSSFFTGVLQHTVDDRKQRPEARLGSTWGTGPASGQHSVIIKRILGLLSNSPEKWHGQIIAFFAHLPVDRFLQLKDLVSGFLAYRLARYNEKRDKNKTTETSDPLVPKVPEGATAASFHAALNQNISSAKANKNSTKKKLVHGDDWQVKAAVRVLRLLFAANNISEAYQNLVRVPGKVTNVNSSELTGHQKRQIVPTSDFYITLLDDCDLVADFEGWEQKTSQFAFCQYPFLLSIWAKIQILEHEARRQMKNKARDAFFDSIMTRRNFDQHLVLTVRRDCLVEDSLKGVSAAIGSGTDDIKKGLRIIFSGEEGIDAGGLRKEWFLLLRFFTLKILDPSLTNLGMFVYDEDSHYCYFNPASFETSDQFFLVGVVLGLAIYNSTILDVALPPFAFRKLLFAAPTSTAGGQTTSPRPHMAYTLADLAEFRPLLAKGLQQLLDYNGDVESTFGLEFTVSIERFGQVDAIPLCPGGESRAVNKSNREEYVRLYTRYLLDTAVSRQFEPFKRGFFTVCGCNALGLFQPDEIDLLVRGSAEPLDVAELRLAASYENWPSTNPADTEPTVKWFWDMFEEASSEDQRKLLIFITGSDRIPVTGPASLSIRILCLGDNTGRFPTARTCFNVLTLYRYTSRETMQAMLWGAVYGSEGFGLK